MNACWPTNTLHTVHLLRMQLSKTCSRSALQKQVSTISAKSIAADVCGASPDIHHLLLAQQVGGGAGAEPYENGVNWSHVSSTSALRRLTVAMCP